MKAVVYRGAGDLAVVDGVVEPPGPGQVQVEVAYTGICGTDLHILHGDMDSRVAPPAVIGHEMSGLVAAVGQGVTGWSRGQPVTVLPTRSCGRCPACRRGHSHVCHAMTFLGIDAPGAMQSYWTVAADLLLALPEGLPLDQAALVEPAAVAVHDVRRARVTAGEDVVVVGGGPIGMLIAAVAGHHGARVMLVERNPYRLARAADLGIEVYDPGTTDIPALVAARTDGAGADVAFEVSGSAAGVDTAVDVLTTRGRLVMVAIHPRPREVNLHRFFWRELELLGARLYQREDVAEAIRLVASAMVPAREMISRVEEVDAVHAAFAALEAGGDVVKVLIDWRGSGR